jgi:Cu2+-exporting ATPase
LEGLSLFVRRLPDGNDRLELSVPGIHCARCIQAVESTLSGLDGVVAARVNLSTRKASVTWRPGAQTAANVVDALGRAGYDAIPFDARAGDAADRAEARELLRCLGVAAFAAGNVMLLSVAIWAGLAGSMGLGTRTALYLVSALIAVPATLYAGRPFYRSAWRALRAGRANMDVPISLAVLLALVMSLYQTAIGAPYAYFDASVTLLFFLLIGRYLDQALRDRTRGAAKSLLSLQSAAARVSRGGTVATVPVRELAVGDRIVVMPGERIPVDCVVEDGSSQVDVSLVTGETLPHWAARGTALSAGGLNMSAVLTLGVAARVEDSLIAELARLMETAEHNHSRFSRLADKAARLYVPVIHTAALGVFIYWWGFTSGGFMAAMHNAVATLIITCPCALGLAVPATQVVAIGRLFRAGVIAKAGAALERLSEVTVAVLDKTGTLTLGRPVPAADTDPALLQAAARLARASAHPLSRAIAAAAGPGCLADHVREEAGHGVEGVIGGLSSRLGRRDWVTGEPGAEADADRLELWFRQGDEVPRRLSFADGMKPDAAVLIAGLRARGIKPILVSGDRPAAVAALAVALGIKDWQGGVGPREKAAYIDQLTAAGQKVLMIGDGLNDAASLAAAHASIAPASAADAALSAADVIVTGDRLVPVLTTLDVARQARRRILQGFAFAAVYNVFAVPFGAAGLVTPVISAIAMSASSIAVMLNALRPMKADGP